MQNKHLNRLIESYKPVTKGMTTFIELTYYNGEKTLKSKNEIKTMIRVRKEKEDFDAASELQKIIDDVYEV